MHIALAERLTAEQAGRLAAIGALAAESGLPAYLVGGPVRDALLGRSSLDLDVTVVGEAGRLAERVAAHFRGRLTHHERFGTAVVQMPGWHVDVATARRESYPQPGALPVVTPAGLDEDLARRDFSYNALALRLDRDPGLLYDPLHGAADLQAGVTRGLHEATFRDDPTRVIRAARYAARLGCPVEPVTQGWLDGAVAGGALDTVTGQRLWGELSRLLTEATAAAALALLDHWGVLARLHLTAARPAELALLTAAQAALGASDADRAGAALGLLAGNELSQIIPAFGLSAAETTAAAGAIAAASDPPPCVLAADAKNSTLYEALAPLPRAAHLAVWVRHPAAREALARFRTLTPVLAIDGHDLQAEGYAPSPAFRDALRAALWARLDQDADREGQLAAARRVLRAAHSEHEP
jgi:tRNA nucleotidyltransferase (CCA-adding enzyme)